MLSRTLRFLAPFAAVAGVALAATEARAETVVNVATEAQLQSAVRAAIRSGHAGERRPTAACRCVSVTLSPRRLRDLHDFVVTLRC